MTSCEKTSEELAVAELRAQGILTTGYEAELLNATVRGDTEMLKLLIQAGAPVQMTEPDGETLLHLATKCGQAESAQVLIAAGLSIEQADLAGTTPHQLANNNPHMLRVLAAATLARRGIAAEHYPPTLTQCCLDGDFATASLIAQAGHDFDARDANGSTALHNCAVADCAEGLRYLLSHGADAAKTDTRNKTPLETAREAGQKESVAVLAAHALQLQGISADAYPAALQQAVWKGEIERITLLSEAGADLKATDAEGDGPVHHAILNGSPNLIEHLHSLGADINTPNAGGQPPLALAIKMDDTESIAMLHRLGVDINSPLPDGRNPLQFAVTEGHVRGILPLAQMGAQVNQQDSHGNSLLHFCASYGQSHCMAALIKAGADVAVRNNMKWSPLHYAAAKKHAACVQLLIAHRAVDDIFTAVIAEDADLCRRYLRVPGAVHQQDGLGCTPLHWAARLNKTSLIPLLLEHGANASAADSQDRTPGDCARGVGHTEFMRALAVAELARRGINGNYTTALHRAISAGDAAAVRLLADAGADFGQPNKSGWPPLHAAVLRGHATVIPYLMQHGANADARTASAYTALHLAAAYGQADCVPVLIRCGADANARARDGSTPLHLAARLGQNACLKKLLEAGANVHLRNERGDTPLLELARWSWGNPACATDLLAAGADLRALNILGENALHAAAISGNKACLALFISAGGDTTSTTRSGKTPRQLATTNGHQDCVRLLQAAETNSLTAAE